MWLEGIKGIFVSFGKIDDVLLGTDVKVSGGPLWGLKHCTKIYRGQQKNFSQNLKSTSLAVPVWQSEKC